MFLRLLEYKDYFKDFLKVINNFTTNIEKVPYQDFCIWLNEMEKSNNYIYVFEDNNKIIGTIKLVIDYKFNNNLSKVGRIEDFVILEEYRGKGLSKILMEQCKKIVRENNCYKLILCCNDNLIKFYEKTGFKRKGNEMCIYYN
jgi:glucosamine-phosphate N-acetyltransferase